MPRRRDDALLRRVGQRVADARRARGFSQEALAEAAGLEAVTLSRWETGDRALSLSALARIARELDLGLGDLLDVDRDIPTVQHDPDEAELLRSYAAMPRARRRLLLRLSKELASREH